MPELTFGFPLLGTKRTWWATSAMSAFGAKADLAAADPDVRN
jgi:hypothetical protein